MITKTEFENKIFHFIQEENLFENCSGLLLAVSGGSDSMAMLRFFIDNKAEFPFPFSVAHVNHQIRKESDEEESAVKQFCARHSIPCYSIRIDVEKYIKGASLEDFSRRIRYSYFDKLRKQLAYSHIATAHNANDNTETFLLNIIRGCGLNGASGIQPKRVDNVVRPLLKCLKQETLDYCYLTSTPFFSDITNSNTEYSRNRLRNIVIPQMKLLNPALDSTIARFMESSRKIDMYLNDQSDTILSDLDGQLLTDKLAPLPDVILSRVIRKYCANSGISLTFQQTCDIIDLIKSTSPSGTVNLTKDTVAIKKDLRLILTNPNKLPPNVIIIPKTEVKLNNKYSFRDFDIALYLDDIGGSDIKNFFFVEEGTPLFIRSRNIGDTVCFPKRPRKTLKKLFIDDKIPLKQRDSIPIIATDNDVVWVYGYGADSKYIPHKGKQAVKVCITFKNQNSNA